MSAFERPETEAAAARARALHSTVKAYHEAGHGVAGVALGALSLRRLVLFEEGAEAPPPEGNAKFGGLAQFGEGRREQRAYLRLLSHQIDARRNDVRRTDGGTKIQARRSASRKCRCTPRKVIVGT
jgi:hypothetical protein